MADSSNPIWLTLDCDQTNVDGSRRVLESHDLMTLFEAVPGLFETLPREVDAALKEAGRNPFVRIDPATGTDTPAWDFILRVFMIQSARMQFLHSMGHLLRGHSQEVFGHARTMIENAGIAYLSRSEPDLGKLYLDSDPSYKSRTVSARILPQTDPLTKDLNTSFSLASRLFHSNFAAVVGLMTTTFTKGENRMDFANHMRFHDVDPENAAPFLRNAGWLLTICRRVLRLFDAAFDTPDCVWHRRVEGFERGLDATLAPLRSLVSPRTASAP